MGSAFKAELEIRIQALGLTIDIRHTALLYMYMNTSTNIAALPDKNIKVTIW